MNRQKKNLGQVILIILLVTTVGLTIGLSLVSRTVQDLRISTQITESSKAFQAAESGIEAALKGTAVGGSGDVSLGNASANYSVTTYGGSDAPINIGNTAAGESKSFWLIGHRDDGTIDYSNPPLSFVGLSLYSGAGVDICWGPKIGEIAPLPPPAIEVTLYYWELGAGYKISKLAFDPDFFRRTNITHFSDLPPPGNNCGAEDRLYSVSLTFAGAGSHNFDNPPFPPPIRILLRITPLYNSTDLVVAPQGVATFPSQGKSITSTGTTTAGVVRKLNVLQGYASLPSIFDYTLFCTNCTN
ncbi:pilus assembly PilX N-terminal domain-containing protein [Candidatus Gottesmanbacteria bacterium]|nr:pilus assembly PilX N-terminal domain-containing protein [Candidatus Gottesmanbacteria bacterium]